MFGRNWFKKTPWDTLEDWQRDVFSKAARGMLENRLNGQTLKTDASTADLTLHIRLNPAYPEAERAGVVLLKPASNGGMEILCNGQTRHLFTMPDAPNKAALALQTVTAEAFGPVSGAIFTPPGAAEAR